MLFVYSSSILQMMQSSHFLFLHHITNLRRVNSFTFEGKLIHQRALTLNHRSHIYVLHSTNTKSIKRIKQKMISVFGPNCPLILQNELKLGFCVKAPSSFTERLSHRATRCALTAWERRRNARRLLLAPDKKPFLTTLISQISLIKLASNSLETAWSRLCLSKLRSLPPPVILRFPRDRILNLLGRLSCH